MDLSVYWYGGEIPRVEPLRGAVRSEVVVVGGGMAGLTCAQTLAARGIEVTVVERAFCGAGASGRSSGFITPDSELELSDLVSNYGGRRGQALWEFAKSGLERIRRTIEELAIDCDYQVQDSLFVARTAGAFRKVIEAEHRTHMSLGYRSTLYDRASLEAIVGSRAYWGGIRYAGTFGMNAYAYCRALRDEIERRGVRIYEGTPATSLTEHGVETPYGVVAARTVVVLIDRHLPALGLAAAAVHHVRTFLAVSRPLQADEIRLIFPGDQLMVWDTDLVYQYFRITGEGRLLVGGAHPCSMYTRRETSSARVARRLHRYLREHFPSLKIELQHAWPGLIGVSKDFAPVVGRHGALPAYFAGAGAGLPWAAALGEYLAQKITDGRADFDQVLSPERHFAVGRRLQGVLGKPIAFALSHGAAKYLRKRSGQQPETGVAD
jgi:gamma-glutamylputrescine oxidase